MTAPDPVLTGLDRLLGEPEIQNKLLGKRLGVLVNQAAVTRKLTHAIDALTDVGMQLEHVFCPEHGLWGHAQDMESVADTVDPITKRTITSLYGRELASLQPSESHLDGLDALVIDVPDIGSRYYTFAASALYMLQAASAVGLEDVWVLDRPNPLGGHLAEGNLIEPGFESFVGALPVPNRHALTLAELLRFASARLELNVDLRWVEMDRYSRRKWFDETGLPWVMPSPNMPTLSTAIVYPGMCLLEATNLSEGRGTTRPFELFGAPFVDAKGLMQMLQQLELPGVVFRPLVFQPTFQKWAGVPCSGLQIHVVDRERFRPYRLGLACVWAARQLYPDDFKWRHQPYEFVTDIPAIDLLCGTNRVREKIDDGADFETVLEEALSGAESFLEMVSPFILYE